MADTNVSPNMEAMVGVVTNQTWVSRQMLSDLMCTVVEAGSGYWADFDMIERTPELDYLSFRLTERDSSDEGEPKQMIVDEKTMLIGLQRLADAATRNEFPAAHSHFEDAIQEQGDAITADVVMQMAIFGRIIYG